jgi:hypothetical protein
MGVVRFAIGFPHTCYLVAAPISFVGMTVGIKMPAEILHARDLAMKSVQFSKIAFFRMARNWKDVFHTGTRCSRMGGDAHSHLRDACARRKSTGTSPPTSPKRKWSISRST